MKRNTESFYYNDYLSSVIFQDPEEREAVVLKIFYLRSLELRVWVINKKRKKFTYTNVVLG